MESVRAEYADWPTRRSTTPRDEPPRKWHEEGEGTIKFGVKRKDAPPRGTSNGKYIKYFKKGEKTIRFLEEFDEWTEFYDHFSQSQRRSFPCTTDRETCPGCTSDNEQERNASFRWLVNCLDPETGYVDLYKIPVSLKEDLERYESKDGTLTARKYTVIQFKSEGKTRYSIEREDRDSTPVSDYADKMQEHESALMQSYNEVWGEDPADGESPVQSPTRRPKEDSNTWKDQDEDEDREFPSEPDDSADEDEQSDEEEYEEIDEETINKMDADELKALFRRNGIRVPRTSDVDVLREKLIEELSD